MASAGSLPPVPLALPLGPGPLPAPAPLPPPTAPRPRCLPGATALALAVLLVATALLATGLDIHGSVGLPDTEPYVGPLHRVASPILSGGALTVPALPQRAAFLAAAVPLPNSTAPASGVAPVCPPSNTSTTNATAAEPVGFPSPSLVALFSAMFANAVTTVLTFPLDTLKTRQQSPEALGTKLLAPTSCRSCLILAASLFRGILPVLLVGVPCCGVYFLLYEFLQSAWNTAQTSGGDLLCACAAQVVVSTVMIPADLLKVQLQAGAARSLRDVCRKGGPGCGCRALAVNLLLTYLRDFSYSCTQMLLYSALRRLGSSWALAGGAIAASVAALVSHPFDALRTRRMLSTDMSAKHISWRDCVAGLGPRLALCCIAGLLFFCNYEAARLWVRLLLQALASL